MNSHDTYKNYINVLKTKHKITTLDYLGNEQFNFSCDVCGGTFEGNVKDKASYINPCPHCFKESQNKPQFRSSRDEYIHTLSEMGYELLEEGVSFNKAQMVRCTVCGYEHEIKPVQKMQAAKKYDGGGRCTKCRENKLKNKSGNLGQKYVDEITARGYDVVSEGPYNQADKINVIRKECGHKFTAKLSDIWGGKSICSVCNKTAKVDRLKQSHMK